MGCGVLPSGPRWLPGWSLEYIPNGVALTLLTSVFLVYIEHGNLIPVLARRQLNVPCLIAGVTGLRDKLLQGARGVFLRACWEGWALSAFSGHVSPMRSLSFFVVSRDLLYFFFVSRFGIWLTSPGLAEEFYFVLVSRLPLWDLMIWSGGCAWIIFFWGRVRVFLFGGWPLRNNERLEENQSF